MFSESDVSCSAEWIWNVRAASRPGSAGHTGQSAFPVCKWSFWKRIQCKCFDRFPSVPQSKDETAAIKSLDHSHKICTNPTCSPLQSRPQVTHLKVGKTLRWTLITGTSATTATRCSRTPMHCDATADKPTGRTAVMSAASVERLSSERHTSRFKLTPNLYVTVEFIEVFWKLSDIQLGTFT